MPQAVPAFSNIAILLNVDQFDFQYLHYAAQAPVSRWLTRLNNINCIKKKDTQFQHTKSPKRVRFRREQREQPATNEQIKATIPKKQYSAIQQSATNKKIIPVKPLTSDFKNNFDASAGE